jgi:hypothetical protein
VPFQRYATFLKSLSCQYTRQESNDQEKCGEFSNSPPRASTGAPIPVNFGLAAIIDAWPALPDEVKAQILRLAGIDAGD